MKTIGRDHLEWVAVTQDLQEDTQVLTEEISAMVYQDLDRKATTLLTMEPYPDQIELLTRVEATEDHLEPAKVAGHPLLLKEKTIHRLQDQPLLLQVVVVVAAVVAVAQHVAEVEVRFIF